MYPKQLLPLAGERTMLQETALRVDGLPAAADDCIVVCNEAHRFPVAAQLQELGKAAQVVLEPEGRNTAPAVALAAFLMAEESPDNLMLVLPADHVILDVGAFRAAVCAAADAAADDKLVTFGVAATRPETGYGYIRAVADGEHAVPVARFVEKPDLATAERYVADGEHFWNSGIFMFRACTYLQALEKHAEDIYEACRRSTARRESGADFIRPDPASFLECRSESIDYAIMEKSGRVAMVPMDAGWSDVGSWSALHRISPRDDQGNSISGDVVMRDCKNTYVQAESRLVAAVGLDDVVIVETKDSTLVARKSRSQDIKDLVEELKEHGREETRLHRQVHRPWGSYDSLEKWDGFQVKRLVVNPGAVLSLQKHARRAEHWVVVRGRARITRNEDELELGVNDSAYIAIGDMHRIANPYDEPLHIVEVQCGDYLGEDDIVRPEDEYGRAGRTD